MTRETIELMAALADERKIAALDKNLRRRFGEHIYNSIIEGSGPEELTGENRNYNVIATAFDYALDEWEIAEMCNK